MRGETKLSLLVGPALERVIAGRVPLPSRQHVEPITSSLPNIWEETPLSQDQKHLCRNRKRKPVCDVLATSDFRSEATSNPSQFRMATTNKGERLNTTSTTELVNLEKKSQGIRKPTSWNIGIWPLYSTLQLSTSQ